MARETERVTDGCAQWPELEATSLVGGQPVRGARRLLGDERQVTHHALLEIARGCLHRGLLGPVDGGQRDVGAESGRQASPLL